MDCLLTSICGGHEIPSGFTSENIKTILEAVEEEWLWEWRFNNGEYSRKAFSRLFVEMKAFIMKVKRLLKVSNQWLFITPLYFVFLEVSKLTSRSCGRVR